MAVDLAKNFAKGVLTTGYDASATSIVLGPGHGARFPTVPFNAIYYNATDYPDPTDDPNKEVVRVTAISTDTLTITRAQEGTSASTKNTASKTYQLVAGPTAKLVDDVVGALFVATASATLTNSTTETTLLGSGVGSATIKANRVAAGTTLRLSLDGVVSSAAVTPGTLRIKVKFGSTVILDTTAQTITSSLTNMLWKVDGEITFRTAGASGTCIGQSGFESQTGALGAFAVWAMTNTATTTIDTTADIVIDITAQWSSATSSNSITCTNCTLELLR